jgi:hypothetical protein
MKEMNIDELDDIKDEMEEMMFETEEMNNM